MNSIRFPMSVLVGLVVLFIAHFVYYYPLLPETVASHFDADGVPNGWMSKTAFVVILGATFLFTVGSTAGVALLLPHVHNGVNVPNREFWMAPERRATTLALISASLIWIACTVVTLLLVINYFVCRLNIEGEKSLVLPMTPTLLVFLAAIGTIVARMLLQFKHKAE